MKILEEWFIKAPWGKIAMISWGNPRGDPVLLVHGRQDSVNTFLPLLEYLPDHYYYVGFDLPGSGKSDDFPRGVLVTRLLSVSAIDVVIRHLKWDRFVYIGHSMGAETGLFYQIINPNRISKLILIDVKPGLLRLQMKNMPEYFKAFYDEYYSNYASYNSDARRYTRERALQAVMKARDMSREQAEVILQRNLNPVGDMYKLSWDQRQKVLAPLNFDNAYYLELFTSNTPTLYINASETKFAFFNEGRPAVDALLTELQRKCKHMYSVEVKGGHDVHFTNPERVEKLICDFLRRDFGNKSKL